MLHDTSCNTAPSIKFVESIKLIRLLIKKTEIVISQSVLSLCLALYIGFGLNLPVFVHHLSSNDGTLVWSRLPEVSLEVCCVVAISYSLLQLAALGGHWVYRGWASVLLAFSSIAAYYMLMFHVVIGYGVMQAVLTTDLDLNSESVGSGLLFWLVPSALLPMVVIWRAELKRSFYSQWRPLVVLVAAVLFSMLSLRQIEAKNSMHRIDLRDSPDSAGVLAHSLLPINWMAGLGMVSYGYYAESHALKNLFDPAKAFIYRADPALDDLTVVFILGESARADHMGLLGASRNTSPLLAREKNLVAFKGRSCDTATKLSMRCMFVREGGASSSEERIPKEKNIFSVLKSLGFASDLYAMQSEIWFYNSIHADNYLFREMIAAEPGNVDKPIDDMLLVPELARSVQAHPKGRHLIVLHTKGQHFLYSQRYPRAFARYQPECFSNNGCDTKSMLNSYDNSMLYTDYVIKNVIDQVRDRKAIVFYASDHGESIDDNLHFHATPRAIAPPEQRQIPMLVWMSDSLLQVPGRQAAFKQLKTLAAAGKTLRHEEIFDSMLGCMGYTSPNGGIRASNNWCQLPAPSVAIKS